MAASRLVEDLACLIVAHNLGDAVIQSDFFRRLAHRGYAKKYIAWTRPQVAFLFDTIPNCEVICSQFPIGTSKQFGKGAVFGFIAAAMRIRRRHPSVTIDLIGDVRDRFFGHLAGGARHLHIGWAPDHAFSRLIRNPFGIGKPAVIVPIDVSSVYDAHRLMLDTLAPNADELSPASHGPAKFPSTQQFFHVGLHPFASQRCKLWPDESWQELVRRLLENSAVKISAFGAPSERAQIEKLLEQFRSEVALITEPVASFARQTSNLDLLVGLDSFSVHMAELQGTATIMINAGNPSALWPPPKTTVLAKSGGCRAYPCFNIPSCVNKEGEYACVRSITVDDVFTAVLSKLQERDHNVRRAN